MGILKQEWMDSWPTEPEPDHTLEYLDRIAAKAGLIRTPEGFRDPETGSLYSLETAIEIAKEANDE